MLSTILKVRYPEDKRRQREMQLLFPDNVPNLNCMSLRYNGIPDNNPLNKIRISIKEIFPIISNAHRPQTGLERELLNFQNKFWSVLRVLDRRFPRASFIF